MTKITIEIHPASGGADAEIFASELASAVSVFSGKRVEVDGKVLLIHGL